MEAKDKKKMAKIIAGGAAGLLLLILLALLGSRRSEEHGQFAESQQKSQQEEQSEWNPYIEKEQPVYQEEEEAAEAFPRIKTNEEGRSYTPYASTSKWKTLSEEEKEALIENTIPVLEDWNKTIEIICTSRTNAKVEPYSYTLATVLHTYCVENGISATEGAFLAYAGWVSMDEEDVYIVLNDEAETVLLAKAIDQGRTWKFEQMDGSKEEILEQAQENENATEPYSEG